MIILGPSQAQELVKLVTEASSREGFSHLVIMSLPMSIEVTIWLEGGAYEKWQIPKVDYTVRTQ